MEKLEKLSREDMKKVLGGTTSFPICDTTCSVDGARCGEVGCVCSFIDFGDGSSGYFCDGGRGD